MRVKVSKEMYPKLPLSPEPVLSGWGTWILVVSFYRKNWNVHILVKTFASSDSSAIFIDNDFVSGNSVKIMLKKY